MQKIIFGIFAHPDDEAFGPCGTLLSEARNGTELHLITLTNGAGILSMNPNQVKDLASVRLAEWQASARQLGASSTHCLNYTDGKLCNDDSVTISADLENIVHSTLDGRKDIEVEFISFDLNGLTGHIDHIVASRSVCRAFYRLREQGLPLTRIRLYCLAQSAYPTLSTDFVFMEAGRAASEITETIDARSLVDDVRSVMYCHQSQRADCDEQIAKLGDNIALDHFIVLT